jgi:Zn-dependent protease
MTRSTALAALDEALLAVDRIGALARAARRGAITAGTAYNPPRNGGAVMRRIAGLLVGLALALIAGSASAQYPTKPVRVVVPFGAGSSTDTVTRIIAQPLGQRSANRCWWRTSPA